MIFTFSQYQDDTKKPLILEHLKHIAKNLDNIILKDGLNVEPNGTNVAPFW